MIPKQVNTINIGDGKGSKGHVWHRESQSTEAGTEKTWNSWNHEEEFSDRKARIKLINTMGRHGSGKVHELKTQTSIQGQVVINGTNEEERGRKLENIQRKTQHKSSFKIQPAITNYTQKKDNGQMSRLNLVTRLQTKPLTRLTEVNYEDCLYNQLTENKSSL